MLEITSRYPLPKELLTMPLSQSDLTKLEQALSHAVDDATNRISVSSEKTQASILTTLSALEQRVRKIEGEVSSSLTTFNLEVRTIKRDFDDLRTAIREEKQEREKLIIKASEQLREKMADVFLTKDDDDKRWEEHIKSENVRWEAQTKINTTFGIMRGIVIALSLTVLSIAVGFVYELIISGGLRGMAERLFGS